MQVPRLLNSFLSNVNQHLVPHTYIQNQHIQMFISFDVIFEENQCLLFLINFLRIYMYIVDLLVFPKNAKYSQFWLQYI